MLKDESETLSSLCLVKCTFASRAMGEGFVRASVWCDTEYTGPDPVVERFRFDSPKAREELERLDNLYMSGCLPRIPDLITNKLELLARKLGIETLRIRMITQERDARGRKKSA